MKFPRPRLFRPGNAIDKYLGVDLVYTLRDLFTGLNKLSFNDNFQSFQVSVTVTASSELAIRNELGVIPTGKIVVRDGGSSDIVDGDTAWTADWVYVKNLSGTDKTVTVIFFL